MGQSYDHIVIKKQSMKWVEMPGMGINKPPLVCFLLMEIPHYHYRDVIMSVIVSNNQSHDFLLNR